MGRPGIFPRQNVSQRQFPLLGWVTVLAPHPSDNLLLEGDLGTKVSKLRCRQKGQAPATSPSAEVPLELLGWACDPVTLGPHSSQCPRVGSSPLDATSLKGSECHRCHQMGTEDTRGGCIRASLYRRCSEMTSELLRSFLQVLGKETLSVHTLTFQAARGTGTTTVSGCRRRENHTPQHSTLSGHPLLPQPPLSSPTPPLAFTLS